MRTCVFVYACVRECVLHTLNNIQYLVLSARACGVCACARACTCVCACMRVCERVSACV